MYEFSNCKIAPGNITFKFKDGCAVYSAHGYAYTKRDTPENRILVIQPADLNREPVMEAKIEEIEFLNVAL